MQVRLTSSVKAYVRELNQTQTSCVGSEPTDTPRASSKLGVGGRWSNVTCRRAHSVQHLHSTRTQGVWHDKTAPRQHAPGLPAWLPT